MTLIFYIKLFYLAYYKSLLQNITIIFLINSLEEPHKMLYYLTRRKKFIKIQINEQFKWSHLIEEEVVHHGD